MGGQKKYFPETVFFDGMYVGFFFILGMLRRSKSAVHHAVHVVFWI
jgi:hypothetical protein